MKLWERFRSNSKSLFVRLLTSFLSIILVLAAFNFFTFLFLKEKIYDEIINYNELNIGHTVDNYENHFRLVKTTMLGLNQSDKWITNLNILRDVRMKNGYDRIEEVKSELKPLYTNPFLHFENIILHFGKDSYVVEKEGTSSTRDMFGKYYSSPAYPPEFWMKQFEADGIFRVLPAAEFRETAINQEKFRGYLLPVIVKTATYNDMYFVVMLDALGLFQAYNNNNHSFYILDGEGHPIFASSTGIQPEPMDAYDETKPYFRKNGHYVFYKKGGGTGFTYVSMVPIQSISSQLFRLNIILITLLGVTILISLVTSVLFSIRFNNPVRQLLDSFQQRSPEAAVLPRSRIREFDLIRDQLSHMWKANQDISHDLAKKTTLLRNYAYTNKLKNIHMNLAELKELVRTDKPIRLVLFRILFKDKSGAFDLDRATYFIREYIDCIWQQTQQESVTFQMERDLVLSLLFVEEEQPDPEDTLEQLKQVLDVDRDVLFLTIAFSPVFPASSDFTEAYNKVYGMLNQRELNDKTQIIRGSQQSLKPYHFTVLKEEEFHTRLMTGSEEAMMSWIVRCLGEMKRKGATVEQYRHFAEEVWSRLEESLVRLNLQDPAGEQHRPGLGRVQDFYSTEQYEEWFRLLLAPVLKQIQRKTEEQDPVISFVMDYMESHLHEDVTLDLLADQLNLTPGYLSTYFKEKTGINFSDSLNDLRVQYAKRLLQGHELKIQDVAARVGYQNVNSFIRMFKRYSGVTPGEYRKKYASQLGELRDEDGG